MPDSFFEREVENYCEPKAEQINALQTVKEENKSQFKTSGNNQFDQYLLTFEHCSSKDYELIVIELLYFKAIKFMTPGKPGDEKSEIDLKVVNYPSSRFQAYQLDSQLDKIVVEVRTKVSSRISFYLVNQAEFIQSNHNAVVYYAILFSAFITIAIFNSLIYFRSGDSDYAAYLPFLFLNAIFIFLSEGVYRYLNWEWFDQLGAAVTWLIAASSVFFANRFIIRFTQLDLYYPKLTLWALKVPARLCISFGVIALFHINIGLVVIQLMSLWLSIVTFPMLIPLLKKQVFSIEYVFVAWSIILLAIIARVSYGLGVSELSNLVIYGVAVASLFESLLLSLALGDKLVQFKKRETRLYERTLTDELTQLNNLRALKEEGGKVFEMSKTMNSESALAMVDIDHFKQVNDNFGHLAGDKVLQAVSMRLKHALREQDILGRYGGEEYLIIMPQTPLKDAQKIMARILNKINQQEFVIEKQLLNLTVSIGLTAITIDDNNIEESISRADRALYKAKSSGRNQIISVEN
ncbi:sensor domain-containing diguanylate cyclase [Aliikangiella coralliicola]|nr:diguanylate cyclase [Aliikangiella coralliicola]